MANFGRSVGRLVLALIRWGGWRDLLARAPLPMLALAASWGVYSFARWFVPPWVAVVTAGAFELVYIGLAVVQLSPEQQRRARAISLGAVVVSMAYNTLDGLAHLRPALFEAKPLWADIGLALMHGVPLALLAYLVADLLLHEAPKSHTKPKTAAIAVSSGRPAVAALPDLLDAAASLGGSFSRDQIMDRLNCSASAADRLLADGLAAGRLTRSSRGRYSIAE